MHAEILKKYFFLTVILVNYYSCVVKSDSKTEYPKYVIDRKLQDVGYRRDDLGEIEKGYDSIGGIYRKRKEENYNATVSTNDQGKFTLVKARCRKKTDTISISLENKYPILLKQYFGQHLEINIFKDRFFCTYKDFESGDGSGDWIVCKQELCLNTDKIRYGDRLLGCIKVDLSKVVCGSNDTLSYKGCFEVEVK